MKTKYVHKIVLLTCPFLEHFLLEASRVGDENIEAAWLISGHRLLALSVMPAGHQDSSLSEEATETGCATKSRMSFGAQVSSSRSFEPEMPPSHWKSAPLPQRDQS